MKGWKIALIAVGSLVGVIALVVGIALWLVFTPSRLTKIVNDLAGKYMTCETRFEKVDLTLFKTFPDAGLKVEGVCIVNPTEGAPSDTVATIGSLTVGVDVKRFLKENKVTVHQIVVEDVNAAINIILKLNTMADYPGNGDMDANGIIDVEDVNAIINIILKLV